MNLQLRLILLAIIIIYGWFEPFSSVPLLIIYYIVLVFKNKENNHPFNPLEDKPSDFQIKLNNRIKKIIRGYRNNP